MRSRRLQSDPVPAQLEGEWKWRRLRPDRRRVGSHAVGTRTREPGGILTAGELVAIIDQLRERCDLVLIDSPPALAVGDAMTLSSMVDAMLIIARAGVIRRGPLAELQRLLNTTPSAKLGFVLTGAELEAGYGGGGKYGYEREYGHDGTAAIGGTEPISEGTPSSERT